MVFYKFLCFPNDHVRGPDESLELSFKHDFGLNVEVTYHLKSSLKDIALFILDF